LQRYYCEHWQKQGIFSLEEEESRHVVQVLRHKVGDLLHLIDGKGSLILAKIVEANKKNCSLIFEEMIEHQENINKTHILISPTKSSDRFEYFLEKACEIGVGSITPLICKRTERSKLNYERMNKILISASKQSKKLHFPLLNPSMSFKEAVSAFESISQKYITSIGTKQGFSNIDFEKEILVMVGPEGDFTEEEIQMAKSKSWNEISLGQSILRVETAGIVVASQLQFLNEMKLNS
jgi:16S rRNA (uracil1498-N3)-methyltransferase